MPIAPTGNLRERHKAETRELIIDAALDMIAGAQFERAAHEELARRVGVARRTIYRYFPDRDSLLEAVWERVNTHPAGAAYGLPTDVESVTSTLDDWFDTAERNGLAVTVAMSTPQGRTLRSGFRESRAEAWRAALAPVIKDLPKEEQDLPLAALQLLRSGYAWLEMGDQWNLKPDEMAKAVRWASRALIEDLKTRKGKALEEE